MALTENSTLKRRLRFALLALAMMFAFQVWAEAVCEPSSKESHLTIESFSQGAVVFKSTQAQEIDVFYYPTDTCEPIAVDRYTIEGGAPELEAVFVHPVDGQLNLFTIVSWSVMHRGVGTMGDYYAVHAYYPDAGGLTLNEKITQNRKFSGMNGTSEGQPIHFTVTTREAVIALLAEDEC